MINYQNWKQNYSYFITRFKGFFENPVIVIYFICIVVFVGSFGVWYSYFDNNNCFTSFLVDKGTLTNLSTYVISILAATMAHFLLNKKQRGNGFKIFSFSLFLLGFISAVISLVKFNFIFGYFGLFLTYLLWIIVFADDETLSLEYGSNPVGGDRPELQTIPGSINNFKS